MSSVVYCAASRARGADAVLFLRSYDCPIDTVYVQDERRAMMTITLAGALKAAVRPCEMVPWVFGRFITDNKGPKRIYWLNVVRVDPEEYMEIRDVLRNTLLKGWFDASTYTAETQTGRYSVCRIRVDP